MQLFITGTDTNIGKTLVSSWLCLHTGFDYFKPIQTGSPEDSDRRTVTALSGQQAHPEAYCYPHPVSPHLAAQLQNEVIDLDQIQLPPSKNLIIEGAGGVLVPINPHCLMIDLIQKLETPVILVSADRLGTINHTLLSLEALRSRGIPILGVILTTPAPGFEKFSANASAIELYGQTQILARLPFLSDIHTQALRNIVMPDHLKNVLQVP